MKKQAIRRFLSYLVDIMVVSIIMKIINHYVVSANELAIINDKFNKINEMVLEKTINFSEYINSFANITHDITVVYMLSTMINLLIIFIYFVLIPYKTKGITLGQVLFDLKTVSLEDEELTIRQLIKRSLILHAVIFDILVLITVYILPVKSYFIVVSFLGIIQFLLVIISGFMILYRKDRRGLHDLIANTNVVYEKDGGIE